MQPGLPATQVGADMNAMFGGALFLYFVFAASYMKAVGFAGSPPEQIGPIAAAFMLIFMIVGDGLPT